jgi:hypothetical protein
MPRYMVEREFPDGLQIAVDETGAKACMAVVESNQADQVSRSKLPIERITEVRVLDPYFYK